MTANHFEAIQQRSLDPRVRAQVAGLRLKHW